MNFPTWLFHHWNSLWKPCVIRPRFTLVHFDIHPEHFFLVHWRFLTNWEYGLTKVVKFYVILITVKKLTVLYYWTNCLKLCFLFFTFTKCGFWEKDPSFLCSNVWKTNVWNFRMTFTERRESEKERS